jgi:CheY-like chemotaxis protein
MARILLIASDELSRDYHAYQLSDRGHAVRWINLSPRLSEEITSFQPEVIVADLSDEYAPADLLWQTVKTLPEPRPAVVFSMRMPITGGRCMSLRAVTM